MIQRQFLLAPILSAILFAKGEIAVGGGVPVLIRKGGRSAVVANPGRSARRGLVAFVAIGLFVVPVVLAVSCTLVKKWLNQVPRAEGISPSPSPACNSKGRPYWAAFAVAGSIFQGLIVSLMAPAISCPSFSMLPCWAAIQAG